MSWTLNQNDLNYTWNGHGVAIAFLTDPELTIFLLVKETGSGDWTTIGNSGGMIWGAQDFTAAVLAAGGFMAFVGNILMEINSRLSTWAATLHPSQPSVTQEAPKTFVELQTWLKQNFTLIDVGDSPKIISAKVFSP